MTTKQTIAIKLAITIIKQGRKYIAYSPALNLSTSGKNLEEARKRFAEITNIFLEEIAEHNWGQMMMDAAGEDILKHLGPISKKEYDYYKSLPDKE
ncbi:MAG: hypothetical protein WC873_02755 [Candidatus Gracilibacteria bacterium]